MIKKVDYLIVGQGLAGSFFAFQLMEQKKSFLIIDEGINASASYVAAGIINPLVLKRLTPSWRVDEFLDYNSLFYKKIEALLGKKYLYPIGLKKLISSDDELHFWKHRMAFDPIKKYIKKAPKLAQDNYLNKKIKNYGEVENVSWVAISTLIEDFRVHCLKNNLLIESPFDYKAIEASTNYKGILFNKLVFCEGAKAIGNPFFEEVIYSLNKGQTIDIESKELQSDSMLKKQAFILPTGEKNKFKVGATFSWKWADEAVEKEKTTLLKEQLEEMISVDFSILSEAAGIRPSAKDRRPVMGKSNCVENYYIFNGMGSRGCLTAPLLALELVDFIEGKKELSKEVNVARFRPN